MKLLKPGAPCPCCGSPLPEGLPTQTVMLLSWLAEGKTLRQTTNDFGGDKMEKETRKVLAEIPRGECFSIGGQEFVVLKQGGGAGTAAVLKDLLRGTHRFGTNNNYAGSNVDRICCDFADELEKAAGEEVLLEHEVDLTSDDGLKDYGSVCRKASLLTCDQYREYVEVLDLHKPDRWWWLATPWSTPTHEDDWGCKCVSPSGGIFRDDCLDDYVYGVRPFCIFKSSIFVSC